MISYSSKELLCQSGSNTKLKSGIFYFFTRRCPMILNGKFSPICDWFVMDLPSSEWHIFHFEYFSPSCLCFHGLCRNFYRNSQMRACSSFLSVIRICGKGKLIQGLPADSHHIKQQPIRTAAVQGWAHFSWWPDRLTTTHTIHPALSLLNIFWWDY